MNEMKIVINHEGNPIKHNKDNNKDIININHIK